MFHLHLTALTKLYEKNLIHKLVQKGYHTAPASGQGITLQSFKNSAALISLQISRLDLTVEEIYSDVLLILEEIGAKYYSLIITAFSTEARWISSNFEFDTATDQKILN